MDAEQEEFLQKILYFAKTAKLVEKYRFKELSNEKKLQLEIADLLEKHHIPFVREVAFNKKDIIDFMVAENVGIEVKIKASPKEIFRQLERYCESEKVLVIILVTNRVIKLPRKINNKFTYVINLGKSWL